MRILLNLDVDDLDRALAFYVAAFGLTPARRFGDDVVELLGGPAPLYLLRKAAGTVGAGATSRDYARHWMPLHIDVVVDDLDTALPRAGSCNWPIRSGMGGACWNSVRAGMTRLRQANSDHCLGRHPGEHRNDGFSVTAPIKFFVVRVRNDRPSPQRTLGPIFVAASTPASAKAISRSK